MSGRREKSEKEKQLENVLKHKFAERFKIACQKKFNKNENDEIGTKELFEIFKYIYPERAALYLDDKNSAVPTLRKWLNGESIPEYSALLKLCDKECLNCSIDYLFGRIDCTTHDIQFIHNQTGLSETAIKELEQLDAEANAFEDSQYDLDTINMLITQLQSKNNSIIHWITTYIRSKGLKGNFWYYTESGTILSKRYNSVEPVIHLEEKSDTFDNLILMGLQNRIKALKSKLFQ